MRPVNAAGSTELNISPELVFINYGNQAWFMVASSIFFSAHSFIADNFESDFGFK